MSLNTCLSLGVSGRLFKPNALSQNKLTAGDFCLTGVRQIFLTCYQACFFFFFQTKGKKDRLIAVKFVFDGQDFGKEPCTEYSS